MKVTRGDIAALCLDFDGTLAHFTGDFETLCRETFGRLGIAASRFDVALKTFSALQKEPGPCTTEILLSRLAALQGCKLHDDLTAAASDMVRTYAAQVKLLPGVREVLEHLQRFPLALISNGPSDMQRAALQQVGIADAFEVILISGDAQVGVKKPDPSIFALACQALNVAPGETLMIGDNFEADVKGALAYGMQAIHLGRGQSDEVPRAATLEEAYKRIQHRLAR